MASCPNKNTKEWKNLVEARGELIAYGLWDIYKGDVPISELNSTVNRISMETELVKYEQDPKEVAIENNKVYRGVSSDAQYTVDDEGNLILHTQKNFDSKQSGVSLTPYLDTAMDYSTRAKDGTSKTVKDTGTVITITDPEVIATLETEATDELTNSKEITVKQGNYTIRKYNYPPIDRTNRAAVIRDFTRDIITKYANYPMHQLILAMFNNDAQGEIYENNAEWEGNPIAENDLPSQYIRDEFGGQPYYAAEARIIKGLIAKKFKEEFGLDFTALKDYAKKFTEYVSNAYLSGEMPLDNALSKSDFTPEQINRSINVLEKYVGSLLEEGNVMEQSKNMSASIAHARTIEKIKAAALDMGINLTSLTEYAKINPDIDISSVNGIADLTRKTIAIAEGHEAEAITEEVVHIATAIMEQTNPGLVTAMISKISQYKIYKEVFEAYKGKKGYQLANGKPDIRKIKKEAVDKLIAELIINDGKDLEQFPELRAKESRNMVQRFWDTILESVSQLFSRTQEDIFNVAAKEILAATIGTVDDITSEGVFEQASASNSMVNQMWETIKDRAKRTIRYDEVTDDSGEVLVRRHYKFDGKEIPQSVTEYIKGDSTMEPRTPLQQERDEEKRQLGEDGHDYLDRYITTNLIDSEGYKREIPGETVIARAGLESKLALAISDFAKGLISSYPNGTRFVVEPNVINENAKLASAIDFVAIIPIEKEGKPDVRVDLLDWKFTTIRQGEEDIPWFKQRDWKAQMGEYSQIMFNYGLQPGQLGHARMIPFIVGYTEDVMADKYTEYASSIEIGKVDSRTETDLRLLPVPIEAESTGIDSVDVLVSALHASHAKDYHTPVTDEQKSAKDDRLNRLSAATRSLQVSLNFGPLVGVAKTFQESAEALLSSFEGRDYTDMSTTELNKLTADLIEFENQAVKFADMDEAFIDSYDQTNLSEEDKAILRSLGEVSSFIKTLGKRVTAQQQRITSQLAVNENFLKEADKEQLHNPEKVIPWIAKTFLEGSRLDSRVIRFASKMIMVAQSEVDIKFKRAMDKYKPLLVAIENVAKARGVSAFSMIGKMNPVDPNSSVPRHEQGTLTLIKKIDKGFISAMDKAKEDKNRVFLMKNMDMGAYNMYAQKQMALQEKRIRSQIYIANDEEKNAYITDRRVAAMKNLIDINLVSFRGYNDFFFNNTMMKVVNEDYHLSAEYIEMAKTPAALAMWEYFQDLNTKAKDMGYLQQKGSSFFPLMEATILQKFSTTQHTGKEVGDFFKDIWTERIEERKAHGKIDPETNEIRKVIPTYFTQTDKRVEALSQDLNKIGNLWTKALMDYESTKEMESTLLTLHSVEKNKGNLVTDKKGNLIRKSGRFIASKENKNAEILEHIINDAIYGITEESGGIVDSTINMATGFVSSTDEKKVERAINVKKMIESSNAVVRNLGVGLKYMISAANWMGQHFLAHILSGGVYTAKEYKKNYLKIVTGNLTTEERAIINMIMPLNEDVTLEMRRKLAKELTLKDRLNTWSFSDVMMWSNSYPERGLQFNNALSFIHNTRIVEDKLVNIREYIRTEDREKREGMNFTQRKVLEDSFEDRVTAMKASHGIINFVKIGDQEATIPGISDKALAEFRVKVQDFSRKLNGQMSEEDKASYKRNILGRSFMMFRTWIPKFLSERYVGINYNSKQDNWEWGRANLWLSMINKKTILNMWRIKHILLNTPEGLVMIDKILEDKKIRHMNRTGQELTITKEEMYDLINQELSSQVKELRMFIGMIALVLAASAAEPPEDATRREKNAYKAMLKLFHKISDELLFFYNPATFSSISKGNVLPALSVLTSTKKAIGHLLGEVGGRIVGNEEMIEKNHPLKYFMNIVPGFYQYQTDLEPFLFPEYSKEKGVIVTEKTRRE